MSSISNYLEEAMLNMVFRDAAWTRPSKVYIALYTSDPTDADVGTEVTGGSYARQEVTFSAPTQEGGKATIVNASTVEFPVVTVDWGTVTHVGIRSALTVGNLLYHNVITTPRAFLINDQLRFLAGELKLDLS